MKQFVRNKEKRYIIKETYLSGIHAGESFYVDRHDFVVDLQPDFFTEDTYSLTGAKIACTRKLANNNINLKIERAERERREKEGKEQFLKYPLYEDMSFEPYEVNAVDFK